jgi:SAM-dependent methyltransferase
MIPVPASNTARDDWDRRWRRLTADSPQLQTQAAGPEHWRRFYDRTASLWGAVTAGVDGLGGRIAELARKQRLIGPGDRVVEIGCGAGDLALAMAEHGALVTAVDDSQGMIGALRQRLRESPRQGIEVRLNDWRRLRPDRDFQLAAACCVPDALSPDGLRAFDRLSGRHCLVVIGHGNDVFPLRRRIWRRAMNEPLPPTERLLPFVMGALDSMGRRPTRTRLTWPARLDVEADGARTFFEAYFSILGCSGRRLREAIEDVIAPHLDDGRVRCAGTVNLVAVWWRTGGPKAAHKASAG